MNHLALKPHTLPADQNPPIVYLASLAEGSRRSQAGALKVLADVLTTGRIDYAELPWHALRYQHTMALRNKLIDLDVYKPKTINRYLSTLRSVLKHAWKLGLMETDAYMRAVDIPNVKDESLPTGRMIKPGEMRSLLQACYMVDRETGRRDAAILSMMYVTGMRRSEICALAVTDFDPESGEIRIIAGKGNKSRIAYVGGRAKDVIVAWLAERGLSPGAMFQTVDQRGNLRDGGMDSQSLYDMVQRRAKQAGIPSCSVHDFRRTAISEMMARGVDIATVADIVGHSHLDTTRRYDRRGDEQKRAATNVYDIPG